MTITYPVAFSLLPHSDIADFICLHSVPRRFSSGAQHAGRGGAGNVFKDDNAELKKTESREQAVVDDSSDAPAPKAKKSWIFGKKQ